MTRANTLSFFTLHLSFLTGHICLLISFIVLLSSPPPLFGYSSTFPHPPSCRVHSLRLSLPQFLLFTVPLLSIYLPLFPSLLPSLLLFPCSPAALSSTRSHSLAHTLRLHHPLSTSTFTLTSPLLSPLCSLSPTNTYHLLHPPPTPLRLLSPSLPPHSLPTSLPIPSSFSDTQPCCLAHSKPIRSLMLTGSQGQSTLSPKPTTRQLVRVARFSDTKLS